MKNQSKTRLTSLLLGCALLFSSSLLAENGATQNGDSEELAEIAMAGRLAAMDDAQLDRLEAAIAQVRAMEPEERAAIAAKAREMARNRNARVRENRQQWQQTPVRDRQATAERLRNMTPEERQAMREELRNLSPEERRERMRERAGNRPEGTGQATRRGRVTE